MPKFTLIGQDEGGLKTTVEFEAEHLTDILDNIQYFLMGVGFTWLNGSIEFVPEEPPHSYHYYDTERNK